MKYYIGGAGTSESTGVMDRVPEAVLRRNLSRNFTATVICNGTDLLIQPSAHVPRLFMESGGIGSGRADCGSRLLPLRQLVTLWDYLSLPVRTYKRDEDRNKRHSRVHDDVAHHGDVEYNF